MIGQVVVTLHRMMLVGGERISAGERFVVVREFETSNGKRLAIENDRIFVPQVRPEDVSLFGSTE